MRNSIKLIDLKYKLFAPFLLVYLALVTMGSLIPDTFFYAEDGNESISNKVHSQNLKKMGVYNYFLANESTGRLPSQHPVTHFSQGNWPRIPVFILDSFGIDTIKSQIYTLALIFGSLSLFFLYRVFFKLTKDYVIALMSIIVILSNYLFFYQWILNSYRVWHIFFFSTLIYLLIIKPKYREIKLYTLFLIIFYGEFVAAILLAIIAVFYLLFEAKQHLSSHREVKNSILSVIGGILTGLSIFLIQGIAFMGSQNVVTYFWTTINSRNGNKSLPNEFINIVDGYSLYFWLNFSSGQARLFEIFNTLTSNLTLMKINGATFVLASFLILIILVTLSRSTSKVIIFFKLLNFIIIVYIVIRHIEIDNLYKIPVLLSVLTIYIIQILRRNILNIFYPFPNIIILLFLVIVSNLSYDLRVSIIMYALIQFTYTHSYKLENIKSVYRSKKIQYGILLSSYIFLIFSFIIFTFPVITLYEVESQRYSLFNILSKIAIIVTLVVVVSANLSKYYYNIISYVINLRVNYLAASLLLILNHFFNDQKIEILPNYTYRILSLGIFLMFIKMLSSFNANFELRKIILNILIFYFFLFLSQAFVTILVPGYVRTGYLARGIPLIIGMYELPFIIIFIYIYKYIYKYKLNLRRVSLAASNILVLFAIIIFYNSKHFNQFPLNSADELYKILYNNYNNKTFATNVFPTQIGYYTKTWAYLGYGEETTDRFLNQEPKNIRHNWYLLYPDRNVNLEYSTPNYFLFLSFPDHVYSKEYLFLDFNAHGTAKVCESETTKLSIAQGGLSQEYASLASQGKFGKDGVWCIFKFNWN